MAHHISLYGVAVSRINLVTDGALSLYGVPDKDRLYGVPDKNRLSGTPYKLIWCSS